YTDSVLTQKLPMSVASEPANEKAAEIDSDGSPYRLLRYEQCLERSEETTGFGTSEARMALAAHRASHWCTSRNSRRLPEGGGDRGTTTGWLGTASTGKTGQRGDHRPQPAGDRKSTRLNSSHGSISYAVCCLKKKKKDTILRPFVYQTFQRWSGIGKVNDDAHNISSTARKRGVENSGCTCRPEPDQRH